MHLFICKSQEILPPPKVNDSINTLFHVVKFGRNIFGIGDLKVNRYTKRETYSIDLQSTKSYAKIAKNFITKYYPKDTTYLVLEAYRYYDVADSPMALGYQTLPYEFAINGTRPHSMITDKYKGLTIDCPLDTNKKVAFLLVLDYAFKNLDYLKAYRDSVLLQIKEKEGHITLPEEQVLKILSTPNRRVDKFLRQEERKRKRSK